MEHTMIFQQFAQPAPDPEIVSRLKQIDDRLDLKYMAYPHRDYAETNLTQNWTIIQRWRQDDGRRKMIMLGQMSPEDDFDIIAWLPVDCSVEQAFGFFERACRGKFRTNKDIEYVLNNLHKWNKEAVVPKEVKEYAEEMIEANVTTLFKEQGKTIPKVYHVAKGQSQK
jgi:hypothetical protein